MHLSILPSSEDDLTILTAWWGTEPAGRVSIRWTGSRHSRVRRHLGRVPEIFRLVVEDAHRRRGIGRELLRAAEAHVATQGHVAVGLAVGVDNAPALRLYETSGYVRAGLDAFESPFGTDATGTARPHQVHYLVKQVAIDVRVPEIEEVSTL